MARVILTALAVIAAVLGYLMDNDLLLGLAGGFFALALILLVALAVKRQRRRAAAERQRELRAASRDEELRSFGISDIRPKERAAQRPAPADGTTPDATTPDPASSDVLEEAADVSADTEVSGGAAATPEDGPLPEHAGELANPPRAEPVNDPPDEPVEPAPEPLPMHEAREDSPFWHVHSPTAITSYLRALWAATDVQTVALFSSDAQGDAYTLEVALSHNPAIRREGRFDAGDHLLDAVSPGRSLTVLETNDPLLRTLPYYKRAVYIGSAAVAPLRNVDGTTVYLVVDIPQDQTAFTERQRDLFVRYADLLGAMLAQPEDDISDQRATPTRRSIIADEMMRAQETGQPLALALVYRADAEEVAQQGGDAVAIAERDLRLHIEDLTPDGRVERFSELVYGAFLYDTSAAIEDWVQRVRARGTDEGLPLVTGVARLTDHRDPDELRADAFNALQLALAEQEDYVIA